MIANPILRVKDIALICEVDYRTAQRYYNDMLTHYKPKSKKITKKHYLDYFGLSELKK